MTIHNRPPKSRLFFMMATDLRTEQTFVIEPRSARRNSPLKASVMSARGQDTDITIEWQKVPLYIRRAARESQGCPEKILGVLTPCESKRPTKTEIRSALAARRITGKGADLLVKKFDEAYRKVEASGGINAVRASVLDRIEAARAGLGIP